MEQTPTKKTKHRECHTTLPCTNGYKTIKSPWLKTQKKPGALGSKGLHGQGNSLHTELSSGKTQGNILKSKTDGCHPSVGARVGVLDIF